jgi:hypothetical protein
LVDRISRSADLIPYWALRKFARGWRKKTLGIRDPSAPSARVEQRCVEVSVVRLVCLVDDLALEVSRERPTGDRVFLSVVSVAEIRFGVELLASVLALTEDSHGPRVVR